MINKLSKLGGWWRLLVVLLMVCTLASTLMVTSTTTPVLAAHTINVTIDPSTIDMGSTQCHTMSVKNNGPASIKKVEVNLPAEFNGSFSLTDVTTPSGWVLVTNTARTKLWQTTSSSAYIARNGIKSFGFCLIAPDCEPGDFYCLAVKTTDTYNVIANGCANIEVTNCAPQFEPEELGCVESGTTVTICSQIVDSSLDPLTTYLYYSTDEGGNWSSALMEEDCLTGLFCADITLPSLPDCSEVWYYMNASDCAGLTGWYPIDAEIEPFGTTHETLLVMSGTGPTINEFINTSPIDGCLAGGSTVSVSWNVSSLCCPVEDMMVQIEFVSTISESYDTTICLATQLGSEDVNGYAIGSATVTLPMVNLNGSYLQLVARDCCGFCSYSDPDIELTCIESELAMFDAITGWHWVWGGGGHPGNYNDRYSIMVIFNKELDPATVSASDFQVTNPTATVTSIELYNNVYPGSDNGNFSVVFLNLNTPLATNALPTVKLAGSVSNIVVGGDICDPECSETITGTQVICEDGIAPVLTLTTTPANPAYGQVVSVSLTSTEPIPAYCCGFCSCKSNYPSVWVNREGDDVQVIMTPNTAGTIWTGTFVNTVTPDSEWSLEAMACTCLNSCDLKPWKDEKCAEASLIFDGFDVQFIELCEGWNLISVPDTLVEPSISKAFSRYMYEDYYGPVNKVMYFTGGTSGQWQVSVLNPVTGAWTGPITTIDPGKAYWVWCEDMDLELAMRLAPRIPVASMPAIPVKTGWNMVGIWDINHSGAPIDPINYFASIIASEKWPVGYYYDHCHSDQWYGGAFYYNMFGGYPPIPQGWGLWLAVTQDGTIYPAATSGTP